MNDKEMKYAITKLADATDRLDAATNNLGKTIDKMTSITALSICGMTICCIILGIVAIFA